MIEISIRQLQAEVDQLRTVVMEQQKSLEIAYQYRAEQDAEIERLRAQLREQPDAAEMIRQSQMGSLLSYQMEQSAEIERLRALIDKHNDECRECPVIEAA
ncbi:MAG TPA: hypothetical protein VNS88_03780 [Nitrospiraceae bacterium]|nr:hypothetical protein [Nitrospiraceae bacterium]